MKYEVLYHRTAPWLPGETTPQRDARMRTRDLPDVAECYPDNYPGKIISVRKVRDVVQGKLPTLKNMADKDRLFAIVDLDVEGRAALASHRRKIKGGRVEPVTFEDRHGATAATLRLQFGDAEDAETRSDDRDDFEGRRFVEVSSLARSMLARTVTHAGRATSG